MGGRGGSQILKLTQRSGSLDPGGEPEYPARVDTHTIRRALHQLDITVPVVAPPSHPEVFVLV